MVQPRTLEERTQALQAMLEALLGSRNVYYNPPASVRMSYPAIVYNRDMIDNAYANNTVYAQNHRYEVTVISRDPDCEVVNDISKLPTCSFDRHFVSDNLHHNVFTLYH